MTLILSRNGSCAAPDSTLAVHVLHQPVLRRSILDALERVEAPASPAVPVPPPPTAPQAGRRFRVLAAEDNKTNQLVFQKMVQDLDIDLVFADSGEHAVRLFMADRPDIVFTDISMPVMDGKQATRQIRQIEAGNGWPRTPIVAMTAHALEGDSDEILAAGVDHYMTKPLRKATLVEHMLAAGLPGASTSSVEAPMLLRAN